MCVRVEVREISPPPSVRGGGGLRPSVRPTASWLHHPQAKRRPDEGTKTTFTPPPPPKPALCQQQQQQGILSLSIRDTYTPPFFQERIERGLQSSEGFPPGKTKGGLLTTTTTSESVTERGAGAHISAVSLFFAKFFAVGPEIDPAGLGAKIGIVFPQEE